MSPAGQGGRGSPDRPHVVVVGGGVTGLSTAWFLRDRARVTVLEAAPRLGGKIGSGEIGGVPVELGPDTFLARVPEAVELCRAVGLGDDLVEPATGDAFVWSRGRLRPIPKGTLGVPTDPRSLVRSGALSPPGMARLALDLVLPRSRWPDDPTVAEVIGARLGSEALERLVEPLVGGINAGRADGLSLAATAPQLAEAAAGHRSLLVGLVRQQRSAPPRAKGPVFLGLAGGMQRLTDRLADRCRQSGVEVVTGVTVRAVERSGAGSEHRCRVVPTAGAALEADHVVLTLPAFAAAPLVRSDSPATADDLASIGYASVAVVTLAYEPSAFDRVPVGAGFLVPRREGRLMTACTFTSSKWPGSSPTGLILLRASAGRAGNDRSLAMDDGELVSHLHGELAMALGIKAGPRSRLVTRWPNGFPQYAPGHAARVDRIEANLAEDLPGVTLAGAAYRGLGIAACIRQAVIAADRATRVG